MKKRIKAIICITAWALIVIALAVSCFQVYKHFSEEKEQTEQLDKLAELIEAPVLPKPDTPQKQLPTTNDIYSDLFEKNADMIGWIQIDETTINYPVMQTPDRPNYYLKHNFDKEYSDLGVPFVSEACDLESSDNLVIFGHHIKGKKMFGVLDNYKSKDFYLAHPIIHFDTKTGFGKYEIIAIFRTTPERFRYDEFIKAADQAAFDEFVSKCKSLSFYDTGKTAKYGEQLLTLSTCEYSERNSRLVVVAKKVSE